MTTIASIETLDRSASKLRSRTTEDDRARHELWPPTASTGLFLARAVHPSAQPRRIRIPAVVAMSRQDVVEVASDAHAVAGTLKGTGFDVQVALLERMVDVLEAALARSATPAE